MFYTKHGRLHTLPRGKAVESTELQYASPLEALRQDFLLDKQHSTGTPKTMPIEKEVELTADQEEDSRTERWWPPSDEPSMDSPPGSVLSQQAWSFLTVKPSGCTISINRENHWLLYSTLLTFLPSGEVARVRIPLYNNLFFHLAWKSVATLRHALTPLDGTCFPKEISLGLEPASLPWLKRRSST